MGWGDFPSLNPYVDFHTGTLLNKLGITDPDDLKRVETAYTNIRLQELERNPIPGSFDLSHLQAIHQHVFQDVYSWAGKLRESFDAVKQEYIGGPAHRFTPSASIAGEANALFSELAKQHHLKGLPRGEFIERAAQLLNGINQIHLFPEGNGRTQRHFLTQLSREAGHPLDLNIATQHRMIEASIAGSKGDHAPMVRLLNEAASPAQVRQLKTAIDFLKQHWGEEKLSNVYLAATVPGQTYTGVLAGRSGTDIMFRDDRNMIVIGHAADVPAGSRSQDRLTFTATDGQALEQQRRGPLEAALPGETAGYEWKHANGQIQSYQHTETHGWLHVDAQSQFYDRQAQPISREAALEQAGHTKSLSNDQGLGL